MKSNIVIRSEEKGEYRKVENLVRESFWNVYRPGCMEHYVLHRNGKEKDMERFCWIILWKKRRSLDAEHCALKVI